MALIVTAVLAIAATSVLRWSLTERRLNMRHSLRLEARNAAEAVAEYAFAQVRHRMDNQTTFTHTMLDPDGAQPLAAPPTSIFTGTNVQTDSVEIIGGVIRTITNDLAGTHFYVDPTDPNNQFDPMKGKRIFRKDVQILAKATVSRHPIGDVTAYVGETLAMREAPLFAHALFYNMDLEISPGSQMTITGPVHTNGDLWIAGPYGSDTLDFSGPVTVAGGVYGGYLTPLVYSDGSLEGGRNNPVRFLTKSGDLIDLRNSSGAWRDHKMGTGSETVNTQKDFRIFTSNTYSGNLQTSVHGVEKYNPVAFGEYIPDPTPNNNIDESVNTGRAVIERPLVSGDVGYDPEIENQKLSRKAGLYIAANPSTVSRVGRKPDGSNVTIPAGQYRAFRADGTEVILPGSTVATAGTDHPSPGGRPVVKIKSGGMTDMRRYTNFDPKAARSTGNRFDPKAIDLIEIDMTALKMAVDWSVNGSPASLIYDYDSPSSDSTYQSNLPTPKALSADEHMVNFNSSHWNGCIYIESVDAENRRDSGVRLINGRGRVASLATNLNNEGLTIATNDALYILGHLNADGVIDTGSGSITNSSRYPESVDEVPVAIAADAITILSQPTYSSGNQTGGWNDAMSHLRHSTSSYSSYWDRSNPSGGNRVDGASTSTRPGGDPTTNAAGSSSSSRSEKLHASSTEVAAALLMGLVPSNKNGSGQQSGGAHNFPRFLEDWGGRTLSMRGSMVALFESRVADEDFGIRYYSPPARHWGFNEILSVGRYPPQTPVVRTYRRVDFTDLTQEEYESLRSAMPW